MFRLGLSLFVAVGCPTFHPAQEGASARAAIIDIYLDAVIAAIHRLSATMSALSPAEEAQLKAQLQDAVISCTERCLYNSAKWYAIESLWAPTWPC